MVREQENSDHPFQRIAAVVGGLGLIAFLLVPFVILLIIVLIYSLLESMVELIFLFRCWRMKNKRGNTPVETTPLLTANELPVSEPQ